MKKLFCLITLLFSSILSAQQLEWKEEKLDIKTKSSPEKLEAFFEYTNKSSKEITFVKVKASCGCVVVDAPKKVGPGESGKVTFKAPIPYAGGSYGKYLSVDTDETDLIEYKLAFKVTNTDPYVPRPPKNVDNKQSPGRMNPTPVPVRQKGYTRPAEMSKRALLVEELMAKQALARKESYYTQEECPFLPLPINPRLFFDYEGLRIYTCCEQCLVKVKESPQYAIIKLAEKTQTPVSVKAVKVTNPQ